jgi:myxalamid-type polyketide synthase MxaE and MxaD
MASDTALELLGLALGGEAAQPVVAAIDWSVLTPLYEARRRQPFLAEVAAVPRLAARRAGGGEELRRRLDAAPPGARREVMLQWVQEEIATVLRLPPAEVDDERGLFDMGLDSLMALDLRGRLEAGVGRGLPATLAFNYPTAAALAAFLAEDGATAESAATIAPATPPAPAASPIDQGDRDDLSEDELAALLARRLEGLR